MTKPTDKQLEIIFQYGAHPLWLYLKEILKIDISDVCQYITKEEPVLKTEHGDLVVRTTDESVSNQLTHMSNNDVIFLINSINTVFESLKAGAEKDGEKILQAYKFKKDRNNNLFLAEDEMGFPVSTKFLSVVKLDDSP